MKRYAVAAAAAVMLVTGSAFAQSAADHQNHGSAARSEKQQSAHKTAGVVKKVDAKAGTVSIAHEPVSTLNWPAMTMVFKVNDKAALDKLATDKKVEFEFQQRGKDYVITNVK